MTAPAITAVTSPPASGLASPRLIRLLALAPAVWVVVAFVHPLPDAANVYESLRNDVGRWLAVHFAQLPLAAGVGALLWTLVRGRPGVLPVVARASAAAYVVLFAASDSVMGIGTGLAVQHANSLSDPTARAGAASTADHLLLNHLAGDFSVLGSLVTVALTLATISTAVVLRRAGASASVYVPIALGMVLFMHVSFPGAFAAACLAFGAWRSAQQTTSLVVEVSIGETTAAPTKNPQVRAPAHPHAHARSQLAARREA